MAADRPLWQYPKSAADLAVREGVPLEVFVQTMEALGSTASRDRLERFYSQSETARALVGPTGAIPPTEHPPGELIQTRSTVTSTGYQYQGIVSAVDNITDRELQIPYSIVTPDLISVDEYQQSAIVAQTLRGTLPGHPSGDFRVLDARLTGVYRLVPLEAA